jgi:hypothetical protein
MIFSVIIAYVKRLISGKQRDRAIAHPLYKVGLHEILP